MRPPWHDTGRSSDSDACSVYSPHAEQRRCGAHGGHAHSPVCARGLTPVLDCSPEAGRSTAKVDPAWVLLTRLGPGKMSHVFLTRLALDGTSYAPATGDAWVRSQSMIVDSTGRGVRPPLAV